MAILEVSRLFASNIAGPFLPEPPEHLQSGAAALRDAMAWAAKYLRAWLHRHKASAPRPASAMQRQPLD
jgi:hypothetical protein